MRKGIIRYKNINLRQSDGTFPGLTNPTSTSSSDTSWKGNVVSFGEYNGKPLKWRVLDVNTTH